LPGVRGAWGEESEEAMRWINPAAVVVVAFVASTAALAQRTGPDAALWNARAAVGELGWRAPDDAYAAIVEVHLRRAQLTGTSAALMARR
jgi:hypothetical protein